MAKLTPMSEEVYNYVMNNGKVSVAEIANAVGRTEKSVGANVTDLTKKGLAVRSKEDVEGADKPVTFVELTPDHAAVLSALADK